ncbi:DUF397 domain-containing protein [Actinomadura rupiterrae]|uniref:DUF397 domain-containing protein n=1 Tax=Actinomadura rupiterrae TaxID=559627 RepID=UPI0020A573C5|nr:DUF397 domain-containing protein [Actinomadura rupiterrae]MCP2335260.1 hypothetical protein [Actinomadura rupiterrae]
MFADGSPTLEWRKSSHSSSKGQCVEVAGTPNVLAIRDSKDPDGPHLILMPAAWDALAAAIKGVEDVL